jgi:general L-amino acid transport system permease protein
VTVRPALLRDERVLAVLVQLAFAAAALGLIALGAHHVLEEMRASNLAPGIDFLNRTAGFGLAEGPAYESTDTYARAFVVGLVNTLRVSIAGIVLATGLGLVAALARLSGNPIASRLATAYIDIFRNTPLLVQLIFWYRGVVLQLPAFRDGIVLLRREVETDAVSATVFLSQRGLALPWPESGQSTGLWLAACAAGLVVAVAIKRWRDRVQERTGQPSRGILLGALIVAAVAAVAWLAVPGGKPLTVSFPEQARFGYTGGYVLTPEFAALLIGLTTYTGAFIAEVIRSGIQSVSKGQREAAQAVGLRGTQVLRLVVLPQALRVIVPPLTSQYLNLAKNSSLGFYIGYPDLFNVSNTIGNQTGQFVVVTAMAMSVYLAISLATSLLMNLYNRKIKLVER